LVGRHVQHLPGLEGQLGFEGLAFRATMLQILLEALQRLKHALGLEGSPLQVVEAEFQRFHLFDILSAGFAGGHGLVLKGLHFLVTLPQVRGEFGYFRFQRGN